MSKQIIAAIIDTKANAIVGPINLFKHVAVAVRAFNEVITAANNQVSTWPDDHALMQLGYFDEDTMTIEAAKEVLLDGSTWKAMQSTSAEGK